MGVLPETLYDGIMNLFEGSSVEQETLKALGKRES